MTQYTILVDDRFESLTLRVSELMRGGWEPQGGVSLYAGFYAQAMVR